MKSTLLIFGLLSIFLSRILPSGSIRLTKIPIKPKPQGDFAIFERNLKDIKTQFSSSEFSKVERLADSIKREMRRKNANIKSIKIGSNVGRKLGVKNIAKVLEAALNSKDSPKSSKNFSGNGHKAWPRKMPINQMIPMKSLSSTVGSTLSLKNQAGALALQSKDALKQLEGQAMQSKDALKQLEGQAVQSKDALKQLEGQAGALKLDSGAAASLKMSAISAAKSGLELKAKDLVPDIKEQKPLELNDSISKPLKTYSKAETLSRLAENPGIAKKEAPKEALKEASKEAPKEVPKKAEASPTLKKADPDLKTVLRSYPYLPFVQDGPYYHAPMELQINTMPNPNPRTAMSPLSIEQLNLSHQANFLSEFAKKASEIFVGKAARFQNDLDLDSFKQLSAVQNLLH